MQTVSRHHLSNALFGTELELPVAHKVVAFAGKHGEYWVFIQHKQKYTQTRKVFFCVSQAGVVFDNDWELAASYHTEDGMRFLWAKE